jgi:hypothetical protein
MNCFRRFRGSKKHRVITTLILTFCFILLTVQAGDRLPVEIRKGTFYQNGKPVVFVGPHTSPHMQRYLDRATNLPAGLPGDELNDFYINMLSDELARRIGFNSIDNLVSMQPAVDALGSSMKGSMLANMETPKYQKKIMKIFSMPQVVDIAPSAPWLPFSTKLFIRHGVMTESSKSYHLNRRGESLKPDKGGKAFSPSDPLGDRILKEGFLARLNQAYEDGGNIYAAEIFSEVHYSDAHVKNREKFAGKMKKRFGSIKEAQRLWGDKVPSFAWIYSDKFDPFASYPFYHDWNVYLGEEFAWHLKRYGDYLKANYKGDSKHLYIHVQPLVYCSFLNYPSMNQVRVAEATDAMGWEGNWNMFGRPSEYFYETLQKTQVKIGPLKHEILYAMVGSLGRPIINGEDYCARSYKRTRVPSLRSDLTTQLWWEYFMGASGIYLYTHHSFSKVNAEGQLYKNLDAAAFAANRGGHYRFYQLPNPWCYPPEALRGVGDFMKEHKRLSDLVSDLPRHRGNVAILFSHSSMLYSTYTEDGPGGGKSSRARYRVPRYSQMFMAFYDALRNRDVSVTPIYEEMLAKGSAGGLGALPVTKYDALIISPTPAIRPETIDILNNYLRKGGKIILAEGALRYDIYRRPLKKLIKHGVTVIPKMKWRNGIKARKGIDIAFADLLRDSLIEAGARILVDVVAFDSKRPDPVGIYSYTIRRPDTTVYLLINWGGSVPARLKLDLPEGKYYVFDPVENRRLGQPVWSAKELKTVGVPTLLPYQARRLIVATRDKAVAQRLGGATAPVMTAQAVLKAEKEAIKADAAYRRLVDEQVKHVKELKAEWGKRAKSKAAPKAAKPKKTHKPLENLLKNGAVSLRSDWKNWLHPEFRKDGAGVMIKDGVVVAQLPSDGKKTGIHFMQLFMNMNLPSGKKYKLSFKVEANNRGEIKVVYMLGKPPFVSYASKTVKVTAGNKQYSVELDPKAKNGKYEKPRSLRFFLGHMSGAVTISDVLLEELK